MSELPIDLVQNSKPPTFRWWRTVETLSGRRKILLTGSVPTSIESAVIELIALAKEQARTIETLQAVLAEKEKQEIAAMEDGLEKTGLMPHQVVARDKKRGR